MLPTGAARTVVVAVFMALAGTFLPVTAAHAADRAVRGGRLDWGIKSSFQSYVTGPIANGSWSLAGGAATVGGSQFRFHSAAGSYDPADGAFSAAFSGAVHFVGHRKSDGTYELDLTIGRPTVRISGGSGTVYADMTSKEKGSGKVTTSAQVPLAALNLSGIDMRGGGSQIALSAVPATLTAQGAHAFAGYYSSGTALDPVSLSVDVASGTTSAKPKPSPSPSPRKTPKETGGSFTDAAVDWGVRRTFREYVTGAVEHGKWTLSGGAQDGGALFRFPRGHGTYQKSSLDARFAGSLRFTGQQGLDLALSEVAVTVRDGRGTLYADVASEDFTRSKVPLVTFPADHLKPRDGLVTVTEAPAKLTADGAKAFGGMYREGTAMDPVSLAVAIDPEAELPALPDLGSDPEPTAKPKKATAVASATDSSSGSSFPATAVGIGAGLGILLIAAITFAVSRRRRAGPAADAAARD